MEISSFDDLIEAARAQPEPQRLLFVFAAVELPDDATAAQRARFDRFLMVAIDRNGSVRGCSVVADAAVTRQFFCHPFNPCRAA